MKPPDRTSPSPPRGTGPDRAAAHQNEPEGRITRSMRRRLEAPPEGEEARPRARRRNAILPNPGGPDNAFAAAAAMRRPGPASSTAQASAAPRMVDVMVSVTENMIGSIYLASGRVRTTHFAGPGAMMRDTNRIQRFNIDVAMANAAFQAAQPGVLAEVMASVDRSLPQREQRLQFEEGMFDRRDAWLAEVLQNNDEMPDWAQRISDPSSLPDIDAPRSRPERRLFEVLDRSHGGPPSTHISRGEMVRMTIPRHTLTVIGDALAQIEHVRDPVRRNEIFFDYLGTHAPDLADRIRRP